MDSQLRFFSTAEAELFNEVLARRSPGLHQRIQRASPVSQPDADEVMSVLSDELTNNLDDDWEPTDYGRFVSTILNQFNAARIAAWP